MKVPIGPLWFVLLAACVFLSQTNGRDLAQAKKEFKKVLFSDIKALTFYRNRETLARRTDPIPQLRCIGKACEEFQPEVVQCISRGDAQWKVRGMAHAV